MYFLKKIYPETYPKIEQNPIFTQMEQISSCFKIKLPSNKIYTTRLENEIKILSKLNMIDYIIRINDIYHKHINKYPNMLRGSSGASLVLYLLGINKIDPVKYSIPLSRFISSLRDSYPDIDIDVCSSQRDIIINEIINANKDTIRMSSNYNNENNKYFADLIKEDPSFNVVHNSGIIIFSPDQKDIVEKNKVLPNQIGLTKSNINEFGLRKIDLLSNTGLEQLRLIESKSIDSYNFEDKKVFEFISNDDGIGITFAETPQIQNVFRILKPKNIEELSLCMGIIRPFACGNIYKQMNFEHLQKQIIYDDDFIQWVVEKFNVSEEEADMIRRLFKKKKDKEQMKLFVEKVNQSNLSSSDKFKTLKALGNLHKYSFCKSHSLNYARLVYCLYWNKFYKPKLFWKSVIKSVKGYYRDWVYIRKALKYNIKFKGIKKCSPFYHFAYTGYWLSSEFMSRCYLRQKIDIGQNHVNIINMSNQTEKMNKPDKLELNELEIDNIDIEMEEVFEPNNTGDTIQEKIIVYGEIDEINETDAQEKQEELYEQDKSKQNIAKPEENMNILTNKILLDLCEKNFSENAEVDEHNYDGNVDCVGCNEYDGLKHEADENIKYNKMCEFRGLIAGIGGMSSKYKKYQMVITIGYDNDKFINLTLNKKRDLSKFKQIFGKGYLIDGDLPYIVVTKMVLI